jgi:hypothetical protein
MRADDICSDGKWSRIVEVLPRDLEESARYYGALVRRKKVRSAVALMRMELAYALSDLSFKDVAAWAKAGGVSEITGPAFFYRFRDSESWLEHVLGQLLSDQVEPAPAGIAVLLVDATVITGPGSTGTDWRAHVMIDPVSGKMNSVELTDAKGGEGLARYSVAPGVVVLGDRAYCTARGVESIETLGADVVVRVNPHSFKVCDTNRTKINLLSYTSAVPKMGVISWDVSIPIPPDDFNWKIHKSWSLSKAKGWIPARIVAGRTKKGEVIWMLTTLSRERLSDEAVLTLYRIRWQIELLFKRMKSLLHLDALPTKDGPTSKSWLLVRFVAAALAQKMIRPAGPFFPCGGSSEKPDPAT